MTLQEIKAVFDKAGLPVAFRAFEKAQALPFMVWTTPYENNFAADNIAYHSSKHITLELYTQLKDPTTEDTVEQTLKAAGIFYEKQQEYLQDERCYMTTYDMEV